MKMALMISFLFFGRTYNIELAITPLEQAVGLMYRREWKDSSQGMLFVNKEPKQVSFWMRNTHLDLIMFYLDSDFNIVELHRPVPYDDRSIVSKTSNIQYVLELNPNYERSVIPRWNAFRIRLKEEVESVTRSSLLY